MAHDVEEADQLAEGSNLTEEDVDKRASEIDCQATERAKDGLEK